MKESSAELNQRVREMAMQGDTKAIQRVEHVLDGLQKENETLRAARETEIALMDSMARVVKEARNTLDNSLENSRDEALEEAAKICEAAGSGSSYSACNRHDAAKIRAAKTKRRK